MLQAVRSDAAPALPSSTGDRSAPDLTDPAFAGMLVQMMMGGGVLPMPQGAAAAPPPAPQPDRDGLRVTGPESAHQPTTGGPDALMSQAKDASEPLAEARAAPTESAAAAEAVTAENAQAQAGVGSLQAEVQPLSEATMEGDTSLFVPQVRGGGAEGRVVPGAASQPVADSMAASPETSNGVKPQTTLHQSVVSDNPMSAKGETAVASTHSGMTHASALAPEVPTTMPAAATSQGAASLSGAEGMARVPVTAPATWLEPSLRLSTPMETPLPVRQSTLLREEAPAPRPEVAARPVESPVPRPVESATPVANAPTAATAPTLVTAVRPLVPLAPVRSEGPMGLSGTQGVTALTAKGAVSESAKFAPSGLPRPHPVLQQMEGSIRWLLKNRESGAELQLHPESLGKLTIKLKVEGNQVHAQVWASEPGTMPILQDHRAYLEVSLREQGLSLGSFELQSGGRGSHTQDAPRHDHAVSGISFAHGEPTKQEMPMALPERRLGAYRVEVIA